MSEFGNNPEAMTYKSLVQATESHLLHEACSGHLEQFKTGVKKDNEEGLLLPALKLMETDGHAKVETGDQIISRDTLGSLSSQETSARVFCNSQPGDHGLNIGFQIDLNTIAELHDTKPPITYVTNVQPLFFANERR